jgi:hypothetical protein
VEGGDKPGVVILTARYDAPRAGAAFSRRWPIAPFALFFWSMSLILVCALVRLAGVEGVPLTVVQFIPTVVLIASVPLFGDIALSRFAHEANGPGVGAVLRLAESHGGKLDHFDVWVVLTGADTALMLGTREWVRARKRELDPERTVFVNVQADGGGALRWAKKEGLVMRLRYHPTLVEICEEIGEGRGITSREATGALAARSAGFPAITIAAGAETADEAYDFCAALLERLDESIGPELA